MKKGEMKWHVAHNSIYDTYRQDKLRTAYKLLIPEVIVKKNKENTEASVDKLIGMAGAQSLQRGEKKHNEISAN